MDEEFEPGSHPECGASIHGPVDNSGESVDNDVNSVEIAVRICEKAAIGGNTDGMTRQSSPEPTPVEVADIASVYETLGLTTASQRAQFAPFGQTMPTMMMSVTISTDSLPTKNG